MKTKRKTIELLNSEGPILVASREIDNMIINLDFREEKFMLIITEKQFNDFINGDLIIEGINYLECSESMKPGEKRINEFLK